MCEKAAGKVRWLFRCSSHEGIFKPKQSNANSNRQLIDLYAPHSTPPRCLTHTLQHSRSHSRLLHSYTLHSHSTSPLLPHATLHTHAPTHHHYGNTWPGRNKPPNSCLCSVMAMGNAVVPPDLTQAQPCSNRSSSTVQRLTASSQERSTRRCEAGMTTLAR